MIAVLGAIVIVVGLNRGWFSIDKEKIREDPAVITAEQKLHDLKADANKELNTAPQRR